MNADPPTPDELWQQIPPAAQAAILALIQHYEMSMFLFASVDGVEPTNNTAERALRCRCKPHTAGHRIKMHHIGSR